MPENLFDDTWIREKATRSGEPEGKWREVLEELKRAEVGMDGEEKAKVLKEAPSTQVVHDWIKQLKAESASRKPKAVGNPQGTHV